MEPLKRVFDPFERAAESPAARRAATLVGEFKQFAFKGNVVDLAVGVIIGAAFGKIVDALVKDVIMPTLGLMLPGDGGFRDWKLVVRGSEIPYGLFVAEVVNFLIVAAALFLFVRKFLGWVMRSREDEKADPPPPTKTETLLTEIRDLLKARPEVGPRTGPPADASTAGP